MRDVPRGTGLVQLLLRPVDRNGKANANAACLAASTAAQGLYIAVLMPMTSPVRVEQRARPLLPGLMAASVWIRPSSGLPSSSF